MARYSHLSNKLIILFGTTAAVLIFLSCVLFVSAADQIVMERVERAAPEAASKKASAGRSAAQEMKDKYNLADDVPEDYPIIFNIILFISVALILALIAICVTIATMDPGRDSLIYRVTSSQRYKKDN